MDIWLAIGYWFRLFSEAESAAEQPFASRVKGFLCIGDTMDGIRLFRFAIRDVSTSAHSLSGRDGGKPGGVPLSPFEAKTESGILSFQLGKCGRDRMQPYLR